MSKLFKWILALSLAGMVAVPVANQVVVLKSQPYIYSSVENIPYHKVGLLLGTGKYMASGRINAFYLNRIRATVALYQAGKISKILVSGDNSTPEYDEPTTMKRDLVALGIPEQNIYLDYAGFRTLDSVVRAKKVFGLKSFTVISQEFHNQRAIFIAQQQGLNVVGFNAKAVGGYGGFKVGVREQLARVGAVLDVWVLNTQPKFLGEPVRIS